MKALRISALMALILACIGYFATVTAQDDPNEPCDLTEDEIQQILEDSEEPSEDEADGCCGQCQGDTITINGVLYRSTMNKEIVVCKMVNAGIDNPNCWLAAIRISGDGDVDQEERPRKRLGMSIETQEGAPSHIQLQGVKGDGTQFPAKVYVRVYANLMVEGLPVLSSTEQVELEADELVHAWPPSGEVVYTLSKPATFKSADGKHTAEFRAATVRMTHKGVTVAAK